MKTLVIEKDKISLQCIHEGVYSKTISMGDSKAVMYNFPNRDDISM